MKNAYWAGALLAGVFAASPALATDEAVLEQLKVMQEQIQALQSQVGTLNKELADAKTQAATATAEAKAAKLAAAAPSAGGKPAPASKDDDVKVTLGPGLKVETADGEYSFKVGGFAQVDAGIFDDDVRDHPDGTTLRRARLNVSGNLTKAFRYKIENDFANNASALTDVYLEYVGLDPLTITVGQFKEPFSLETLTSDLFTTFIERASPTAFSPDRRIGIAASGYGDSGIGAWTASAGVFGAGTGTASNDDESRDFTGRLTLAPIADKTTVLHFGMAGSYRIPDAALVSGSGTDVYRVNSRPETALTSSTAVGSRILTVDTGNLANTDHVNLGGLEAAGVYGPFAVQGEYMVAQVERETGSADATLTGYYAEASYFLTGESKNYNAKQAKFERVKPLKPFSLTGESGWGAWQVAARYSNLDLNDGALAGGEMDNVTLGLKWLPTANTAIVANYTRVDTDANAVTANDDPQIWMLRTQFDF